MAGFQMMGPSIGRELVRAKLDGLYAEAARDGRTRRPRESRRPRGLRLSLVIRLVSAGYRLLGDPVEVR